MSFRLREAALRMLCFASLWSSLNGRGSGLALPRWLVKRSPAIRVFSSGSKMPECPGVWPGSAMIFKPMISSPSLYHWWTSGGDSVVGCVLFFLTNHRGGRGRGRGISLRDEHGLVEGHRFDSRSVSEVGLGLGCGRGDHE